MQASIGCEVKAFPQPPVCEIASVELAEDGSETRMERKMLFRLGRVPGARACCGDTLVLEMGRKSVVTLYDDHEWCLFAHEEWNW
jgi:hypothetical protein